MGLDLGSSRFVLAAARRGNVEIITNDANYRQTPNITVYGSERTIGDPAFNRIKKELRNSILFAPRFLGDLPEDRANREFWWNYCKPVRKSELRTNFMINWAGETQEITPEQAVATLFTKAKKIAAANGQSISTLVVSVPDYFGVEERQAMIDAAKIAGVEITQLMNESSAILLNYGIFRKGDLDPEKGRVVIFADVGHSRTTVFGARVFQNKAEVLFQVSDPNLGTRDLDLALFTFYSEKILAKTGQLVAELPKSKFRLLEAIEKQRKVLTANSEANISVDCIVGEIDFTYFLKRDEFINICAPIFERWQTLFLNARQELGANPIHSFEKVGGGSRIPHVEKIMTQAFGVETISKTLDAGECVARGCAIRSAMMSPLFKVAEYQIKDRLTQEVRAKMKYESDPVFKENTLFAKGCEANKTISITLAKNEKFQFEISTHRPLIQGEVEQSNPKSDKFEAKVFFHLDPSFVLNADRAEIKETFLDSGMVVEGQDKKEEKKERTETRQLQLKSQTFFGLPATAINQYKELEQRQLAHEEHLHETQKAKYALESFIYDTREDFEKEKLTNLATPQEKDAIRA